MSFPLNKQLVDQTCIDFGLRNAKELGASSIRQLVGVVKDIERATGVEFIIIGKMKSPILQNERCTFTN